MKLVNISFPIVFFVLSITSYTQEKKDFVIPPYFIAKAEAYIYGNFDANGTNTVVRFENNRTQSFDVRPLIENKNKILIRVPETSGQFELVIADEGTGCELFYPINIVNLQMEYDELIIGGRSQTEFRVRIKGTKSLEEEFTFTLTNRTPHIVNLSGGNVQKNAIRCSKNDDEVVWRGNLLVLDKGDFIIENKIEQPKPSIEIPAE